MKLFWIICILFLTPLVSVAQLEPTVKELEELKITVTKLDKYYVDSSSLYMSRADIDALQPDDLGELIKKMPGVNVKSYGGLGGMKTVAIRGLSGQHTNFVVDGFSQMQTQTGQVNLGMIQMDNIERVTVQRGGTSELAVPAAAQLSGNAIILETFQSIAPKLPMQQKLISKFGSFGQIDQHFIAKTGGKKVFAGLYLKYRQAHGEYPYRYKNYKTWEDGTRKNNDFMDLNGGANISYHPNANHHVNFHFQHMISDQGVPGAVVLYNDLAKQRLTTSNTQVKLDYRGKLKFLNYRFHYTTMGDSLHYLDPSYLNAAGELRSSYHNRVHDIGLNIATSIWKKFHINVGAQEVHSKLRSVDNFTSSPERFHLYSFAKATFSSTRWKAVAQLGLQHVSDKGKADLEAKKYTKLNPYLEVRYAINEKIALISYYRNSFRMANFNELYYNNIGNNSLEPEKANQISLSTSVTLVDRNRFYLGIQVGAYYNEVKNMILSIPTKNLFVWSIQNIGKNEVKGLDAIASLSWAMGKSWSTQMTANYTLQQSLDVSDRNSPSYQHQIAYQPLHVINADISLHYKSTGLRFSTFHSSSRYVLNQNLPSNLLEGFSIYDLSLFHLFQLGKNNSIRLQITSKNITNESYAYVKNYIMPGRHFIFTFVYAFI